MEKNLRQKMWARYRRRWQLRGPQWLMKMTYESGYEAGYIAAFDEVKGSCCR